MKKNAYLVTSSLLALSLFVAAAPAFAQDKMGIEIKGNTDLGIKQMHHAFKDNQDNNNDGKKDRQDNATTTVNSSTVINGNVSSINGSIVTVVSKNGTVYTVNDASASVFGPRNSQYSLSDIKVGDAVRVKGDVNGTTVIAQKINDTALGMRVFLSALGFAGAGVVTSTNGNSFTLKSLGSNTTTTVNTNGSTVYKVNGLATSSNALSVGSPVLLTGTTNNDNSIAASIINIIDLGLGFIKTAFFF